MRQIAPQPEPPVSGMTIPFFTDQCVPDSVGVALERGGHDLTRLRDAMETDTADHIIAVACSRFGQVLVTHDKDFKLLSKRLGITQRQYHDSLHRIQLACSEPEAAARIAAELPLIEFEWARLKEGEQMIIEIRSAAVRILRKRD